MSLKNELSFADGKIVFSSVKQKNEATEKLFLGETVLTLIDEAFSLGVNISRKFTTSLGDANLTIEPLTDVGEPMEESGV